MISSKGFFSFALLFVLLGCSAPATNSENARGPSSAPPGYVQPIFHSNKKPTRDELYQNARVPAHREFPLSEKIKPCDDFYEYVCSEVKNNFTLPDDRSRHSFTFSDPNERLLAAKKNYLAFLVDKPHLTPRQKILKTNYVACLNEPARAAEEKQSVASEVAQITALSDLKQLRDLMSQRMLLPEFSMASLDFANSDLLNKEKYNVYVVAGSMTLPERSYYHDQKVRDGIKSIYTLFFKTIGRDNADARAEKLLDFETRIADTKPLPAEMRPRRSSTNYIVKREDLLSKYPAVMFEPALKEVAKDTQLVDLTPEVTQLVNDVLSNGDLETLKDYILYRGLAGRMDEGYPEFFAARFQFENQFLGGPIQRPELHERCAQFMDRAFNFELSAELLPLLFASDTQVKVQAIADKVRATKLTEINETKWISEQGRAGALAKMKKLRLMIFKPKTNKDWLFNGPGAVYKETTFIQNAKNTSTANLWRDIRKTKLKRNHDEWHMSPTTVNAYYSPSDNQFVLPASVFQAPFYVEGAPQYLNVASIGSVTGHEIGHSIDDQGANFDANGEVRQWLSDADLKEFHKQADEKLVKLFDTITVNGMPHNGKLTLGENIGDNVGLRTAYRVAFENTDKVNPEELKKMKQLFFAQYARVWCYVARPKAVEAQMKTDPHALGEGRANGQVVQMDGFYDAYSCKPGDKMYVAPENRVKIW